MQRINVVGTSCSGKTTLARDLADRLRMPHVEFDALFWSHDWTPVAPQVFRDRVRAALAEDRWVADGGYAVVRDVTWSRADRESISNVLRRDGLLWWILGTHRQRRRDMTRAMAERADLRWVRLGSPAATERWLASIPPVGPAHR